MSTANQSNGKKSSNSSVVNTPASTPIMNINGNSQVNTQSTPPPNNNAPKYGTLVPNRIFVGGISANTTEGELMQLFSSYGTVKAAKIIQDRAGVSKGYGFITFESEDDAKRPLRDSDNIVLRERKLNIAPAIKKQPFSRAFDASSPPAVAAGNPAQFFFPPGAAMPYFQGGVAYYPQPTPPAPPDVSGQQPVYQPAPPVYQTQTGPPQTATYPSMMFPQTIYMPQQYPMPMPYDYNYYQPGNGAAGGGGSMPPPGNYLVGGGGGPPGGVSHGPNSPPRPPPCYGASGGQQMAPPAAGPYAAAPEMFYNVPIYGGHPAGTAAMEGAAAAIYADGGGFDMGPPPTGAYAEDAYPPTLVDATIVDQHQQDLDHTLTASQIHETITTHQQSVETTTTNNAIDNTTNQKTSPLVDSDTARNSNTPVVSLLSIDQQQEKDYTSMQGGRRRKSQPPPSQAPPNANQMPPQHHHHHAFHPQPNGYVYPGAHAAAAFPHHHHHAPPPNVYSYHNGQMPMMPPDVYRYNNNRVTNGYRKQRRPYYAGAAADHSSRSSLRTDSNSSASCVDENKNEEKSSFRTTVNTPPPAPYSPMTNHGQYKIITNSHRNYQNSTRGRNNYSRSGDRNYSGKVAVNNNVPTQSNNNDESGNTSNVSDSNSTLTSSQMHGGNFQPPVRRSRRSIRRNTGGAPGSEIGAGDAPLPNETADIAKKMEALKL